MKVLAVNGSPHKEGNTYLAIRAAADVLEQQGIACEIVHMGGKAIHGCIGCGLCAKNKNERCGAFDDGVNELVQQMKAADAVILGSPVYYAGVAGTMKALCDRAFYVGGANGGLYRYKPGAALVALRRGGGVAAFDQLNHYFTISEMPVVSSSYWNAIHGAKAGEALEDGEGMYTARTMGAKMAWILKLMEAGKGVVESPEPGPKVRTNFIR
jgi:multimeric flavodoxin WrbA